jgi:hypothetical protein
VNEARRPPDQPLNPKDPRAIELRVQRLRYEAEKIIEEAISPENLKKNPFKGKPIHLEDNPFDRGLGMAHRMLKNSGHTLPWIETKREIIQERKAIDQAIEQHLAWLGDRIQRLKQAAASEKQLRRLEADHDRFLAYLHDRVAKLRQTIERYNLEVPLFDQQVPNVRPETYIQRVQEKARPLLAEVGIA